MSAGRRRTRSTPGCKAETGFVPGWNFNKVLIAPDGSIAGTFGSSVAPGKWPHRRADRGDAAVILAPPPALSRLAAAAVHRVRDLSRLVLWGRASLAGAARVDGDGPGPRAWAGCRPTGSAPARAPSPRRLALWHEPDYVAALQAAETMGEATPEMRARFQLGTLSNPVFPQVFRRPATGAGGRDAGGRTAGRNARA